MSTFSTLLKSQTVRKPLISERSLCTDVVQTHMCKCTFTRACTLPHLDAVLHLHVSQQFAIDTEETELSFVVVDHAVSLSGRLDETGSQAALWTLQGPQQVPIHGMDQTRTLCSNKHTLRVDSYQVSLLLTISIMYR